MNLMKELGAKWTTARGAAKWARRNIGWHYGTLSNGEPYCVSGHYDAAHKKHYVALIVYGSGDIKANKNDLSKIKTLFNMASKH